MERFTNQYINLTRKYTDDLGDDEVEKRLTDEVAQVQPSCLPCGSSSIASAPSTDFPRGDIISADET
jgi:hypothetical protein